MGQSPANLETNDREPAETANLDRYGHSALPWSRPRDLLAAGPLGPGTTFFLGTARPDGRPHAAGVGAVWMAGDLYFTSGPGTRKARNLVANPACTLSVSLDGIDLVLEGDTARVLDHATLEQAAALYREAGWPAEVAGEAFTAPYSPRVRDAPGTCTASPSTPPSGRPPSSPSAPRAGASIAERVADLAEVLPGLSTVGRRRSAKPPCCDETADPPTMNEALLAFREWRRDRNPEARNETRTRDPFLTIRPR